MSTEQLLYTAVTVLASVVTALASAVVWLFFWFKRNYDRVNRRLELCEKDRADLWEQIADLRGLPCKVVECPFFRDREGKP